MAMHYVMLPSTINHLFWGRGKDISGFGSMSVRWWYVALFETNIDIRAKHLFLIWMFRSLAARAPLSPACRPHCACSHAPSPTCAENSFAKVGASHHGRIALDVDPALKSCGGVWNDSLKGATKLNISSIMSGPLSFVDVSHKIKESHFSSDDIHPDSHESLISFQVPLVPTLVN